MAADRETSIGAFVFGGIVLVLAAIVLFGNFRLFSPTKRAVVIFEGSISGLSVGAPVNFRGVRVGAAESIALQFAPRTTTAYIPVTLQLEPERVRVLRDGDKNVLLDLPSLITRGLRAELNTQSFVTGQSEINLDFDPGSTAVLHPGISNLPEIPTRQSAIQRVTEQLTQLPLRELVANANTTLESLHTLSTKLDTDLPPLFASVKATSDGASHAVGVASQAIADMQGRLAATLDRVNQLAGNADQQLSQRSADLHALLLSATQTITQTHDVLTEMISLMSTRGQARANLEATLRDLAASAASLRGFANDVEHNPQLLLTGRRQ